MSDCLGMGEGPRKAGGKGLQRGMKKRWEAMNMPSLDCSDGFTDINIPKLIKMYPLNICTLLAQ